MSNRILVLLGLACLVQVAKAQPNIVFIFTDDQAPTAVGISGNAEIQTPHLDQLFRDGAYLKNAFVTTPVCSPSRASLMTGRYASEVKILDWINPRSEAEHGLDPETVTWSEVLAEAGYRNGLVGKWHLGTADRFHPTKTGYHFFMGLRSGGCPPKDPRLEKDGVQQKIKGFTADILTDEAIAFLERNKGRRFCLSLHYRAPHAAWLPVRPEDWAPYEKLDPTLPDPNIKDLNIAKVKRWTREYYASVSSVDRNVGRVLSTLDRLALTGKTVVIFTSDHGYHNGHHGLWYKGNAQWQLKQLPKQKWPHIAPKQRPNLLDQALRVPTAIRWPGVIRPGTVIEQTISNLDWYPTLLAMAKVKLPPDTTIRGKNFLPILQGKKIAWNNDLYAEYSMRHGAKTDMRAYRTPDWKLMIDFKNPGRMELYHLAKDPGEKKNLAQSTDSDVQAIKSELEQRIRRRMKEIGDTVSQP